MFGVLLLAVATNVTAVTAPVAVKASTNCPPAAVSVWNQARRERIRTDDLLSGGAIDEAEAMRRRQAIRRAFVRVCRAKEVPEAEIRRWLEKLGQ